MSAPRLSRWFGWLAFVCVLAIGPWSAHAQQRPDTDRGGDGQGDRVMLNAARSPVAIRVWLSTAQQSWVSHSRRSLLRLVSIDLDGDGRPELVATERGTGLQVWRALHGRLRPVRPRRLAPRVTSRRPGRSFEHDPAAPGDPTPTRADGDPAALDGFRLVIASTAADAVLTRPLTCAMLPDRPSAPSAPRAPPFSDL